MGLTEANDDVSCIRHNLDVKTSGDTDSKSDESKNSKATAKCTPRVYKRRCTISKNNDSLSSLQVLNENISVTIVPKETNQFAKDNAENVISNRNALGKFENQKETGSKMILCNEKTISAASEPQEVQTMTNKIAKDSTNLKDIRNERNTSLEKFTVENDEENSAIKERLYLKESRNIKEGIFINETTCMTQTAVCFDHAITPEKVTVESIDLEEAHCCRKNVTIDRLIDVEKGLLDDAIVDNLETRDYGSLADKQQYSQDEENFSEMEMIEYNLSEKLNEAKAPDKVIQIDEIAIENNKKECSENIEAIENVGGGENINTNQEINNISATQFQDIGKEQEFMASSALNSSQTTNIISESEKKLDVLSSFQDTNNSSHFKSNEKQILILSEIQNVDHVDPCTTMKIKSLSTSNIHTDVQIMETNNVADANDVPLNLRAANLNDEANNNTQHIQNDQNTTLINNGNNEKHSSHTDSTQREKVVFSIAKVNLNDETTNLDYVFLSDSDNSSRKSCDETHCHIENNTYERENQFQPHDLSTKSKCNGHNNKKQTRNSPSNTYETNIHVQSDNISNSDNENSADAIPTLLISDSDDEEDTRSTAVANDVIYLQSKGNCAIAGEFPEYEECVVVESQNNENNPTVNTNVQPGNAMFKKNYLVYSFYLFWNLHARLGYV